MKNESFFGDFVFLTENSFPFYQKESCFMIKEVSLWDRTATEQWESPRILSEANQSLLSIDSW